MRRRALVPLVLAAACVIAPVSVTAQQPLVRPVVQGPSPTAVPDEFKLNLMIRGTIIALSQANQTGNYTVLRELGTPGFQMANNPARLAEIFAPLRGRKLDLTPIMFFNPKLIGAPAIQDGQVLRLTGFFATNPEQVNFDLAFQVFGDQWMLSGLSVSTVPSAEAQKVSQSSALPSPSLASSVDKAATGSDKPAAADGKPIRIDLSEPAPLPVKKKTAKKAKPAPVPDTAAPATTPDTEPKDKDKDVDAESNPRTKSAGTGGSAWRPE